MNPLVSIIIPVYNRALLIAETLNGMLSQTYQNWECILVDDHSTDNSLAILESYKNKDSRFKTFIRPDSKPKGANACRNFGFTQSKGDYVNWFDSDDIMHKDFIKLKLKTLLNDELDGVISKTKIFSDNIGNIIGKENRTRLSDNTLEDFLKLKLVWYLPDVMWKRDFLISKTLFNEELLAGQDRDFHARMLLENPKLKVIDEFLVYYRRHSNNISAQVNKSQNELLRRSHLQSLVGLLNRLEKENKLSRSLKLFYFKTVSKYLPSVIHDKVFLKMQLMLLKKLSFLNLRIVFNWIKFGIAYLSYKLFNRGEKLLR